MSLNVRLLKCRVRLKSDGTNKNDQAKPATPSLEFAQPEPLSPKPRMDAATDDGHRDGIDAGAALRKADSKKVADRVYELMQREITDARTRGGAGRKR